MSSVLRECAPRAGIAALSGPTLATEVARGFPAAIVAAGQTSLVAQSVQELFHQPAFRVYTSTDLMGVELGGALKNIIAIGAGVGDGLGFGDNSKAALVTRAIAEMRRLGVACGAQAETFAGLSGLGDLTVTCFSKQSRNRTLGERLGRGETLAEVLASSSSVAEGVPTARAAYRLARKMGVETPIIDEVYAMLYEGKNFSDSLRDLMARSSKAENA
jgi:glycerol-3-phosphate dehydrogenase (NAD(P)+)